MSGLEMFLTLGATLGTIVSITTKTGYTIVSQPTFLKCAFGTVPLIIGITAVALYLKRGEHDYVTAIMLCGGFSMFAALCFIGGSTMSLAITNYVMNGNLRHFF